mgnify:CR=1 FL=1
MATLAQMRTEARSLFSETDINNTHVTEAQLNIWANEGYRFILTKTKDLPKKENNITSATGNIAVSLNTLTLDQASILNPDTSKYQALEVIDLSYLALIAPGWISTTADEPKYLVRKNTFAYYLYPQPKTSWEGQNIRTYGMEFPADMSSDSESPDLPANLHDIIPHFMAYRAFAQLSMHDKAGMELEFFRSQLKSQREISTAGSQQGGMWRQTETDDV